MPNPTPAERVTQNRLIKFFQNELGYTYLGDLSDDENYNVRWSDWKKFLEDSGYNCDFIEHLQQEFSRKLSDHSKTPYAVNKEIYSILKYGMKLPEHPGEAPKTVYFIDWERPEKNNFYIAEEVTINDNVQKRPDIVLYINGIAVAVIELKKSTISVAEGIRQNITNQHDQFIQRFFSTIQICAAANDSEGMRYGTSGTTEKYYLEWKEDCFKDQLQDKDDLDKLIEEKVSEECNIVEQQCYRIFQKERFLDIIHNFIIYDSGIKKVCRYNQFYAIKRCEKRLKRNQGGIVWHTQGSGKSLTMVWLAKWILDNIKHSRVLIITDREELDDQIEKIFQGVDLNITRSKSSDNLLKLLDKYDYRLMCSLIHKFGRRTGEVSDLDYEKYVDELKKTIPPDFKVKDKVFVFVDECHRTNSGKLHIAMKSIMPDSVFIGFTGTPLLKVDKAHLTTATLFGGFIHKYKFDQAVIDRVVVDLRYDPRDIPQEISSKEKIDIWFETKTKGLMPHAAAALKEKWATMQKLYSSKERLQKIALDIIFDFETKPRLCDGRGNALLVAGSIAEACRYYEIFQENSFKSCAIISSYRPNRGELRTDFSSTTEDSENWKKQKAYLKMLGYNPDISVEDDEDFYKKIESFEKRVKNMFVDEPANMKLLIVVDKLLTGFDAPPCTYLYIDKQMHDHGLFQAICRVNRIDGEDKEFGYIVDYKGLFSDLKDAVNSYTGEALSGFDEEDIAGFLKNRLDEGKKRFESLLQELDTLTDDVEYPRDQLAFKHFFCGESGTVNPENDEEYAKLRNKMYKLVASLARAYADLKPAFDDVGYSKEEQENYNRIVKNYVDLKDEIGLSSGDFIDLKQYDSAMRHLIDNYISAQDSEKLGSMENFTLLAYIKKKQEEELKNGTNSGKKHSSVQQNVAETIENNLRREIIEKTPINPKYYQKMSELFQTLIEERRQEVASYREMLKKYEELVTQVNSPEKSDLHPESIRSSLALCALYDNFGQNEDFATALHNAVMENKQDHFRGDLIKERQVKGGIYKAVQKFKSGMEREQQMQMVEEIYKIVKEQAEY